MLYRMLDTDVCIDVLRGRMRHVADRFDALAEELAISAITLGELYYGVEKSRAAAQNRKALEHLVARLEVLPFDAQGAAHHGQLWAELEAAGAISGAHDMQIGAHARSLGLIVVTANEREFKRMPGLRVENWRTRG
jgi:tRNA(fMet)-specific endonuclease VapC